MSPMAPPRACHCGQRQPCLRHTRAAWAPSVAVPRLAGRANQARRQRVFARNPLCVRCLQQDRVSLATIADHIINLQEGGVDDETNLQGLCQACSDVKTHEEATRGLRRRYLPRSGKTV